MSAQKRDEPSPAEASEIMIIRGERELVDAIRLTKPIAAGGRETFSFIPRDAPWATIERFWFEPVSDALILAALMVADEEQMVGSAPASLFTPGSPLMRSIVLPTVWATSGCTFTLVNTSAGPMDVTVAVEWSPGE